LTNEQNPKAPQGRRRPLTTQAQIKQMKSKLVN